MSNARWTDADDARLKELLVAGATPAKAAAELGRTAGAVNMRVAKLGLKEAPKCGDRSPDWVAIQRLCADGIARTVHEMAAGVGIARDASTT